LVKQLGQVIVPTNNENYLSIERTRLNFLKFELTQGP